ncbi:MAG: caspase family protein [Bacteroidales bacterium]
MKPGTPFRQLLILGAILPLFLPGFGQELKSEWVRIAVDNLPDTTAPTIRLMSPFLAEGDTFRTDMEELDLVGEVRDQGSIRFVSVNSDMRSPNEEGYFSARLPLTTGLNPVRILTSDDANNLSESIFYINFVPPRPSLAQRITTSSRYYGLIIGVGRYRDPDLPDLDNPVPDAQKLYQVLRDQYSFREENMTLLRDAGRNEIVEALDHLAQVVTPEDNVLIFYAGHGTWDERANVGYWLPSDAYLNTTANWFRNSTLVDYLKTIDSRHTLLITDACFAGAIFNTRSGFRREDRAFEILYELPSRKAMTSGT